MSFVINQRVGEVHDATCARVRKVSVENITEWNPEKAHLSPGVTFCPKCLTEVPAGTPPPTLLEVERQRADHFEHLHREAAAGRCGYSGMSLRHCKNSICDCFEYEWLRDG